MALSPRAAAVVPRPRSNAAFAVAITIIVLGGLFSLSTGVSAASTFHPTRFDDPAPNGCRVSDCSLREAVIAADAAPGSTIQLKAGTYKLTRKGVDTNAPNPAIGDLDIRAGMTISGDVGGGTFVQFGAAKGKGGDRIFDVFSTNKVTISHLTIRYGSDVEVKTGGCVRNIGRLLLLDDTVTACTSGLGGGGIASYGTLTIQDSIVSNNSASSAIRQVNGGGITGGPKASGAPGTVTIIHSQIINNTARSTRPQVGYGGGFANTGTMTIRNSVIGSNQADSSAAGLSNVAGSLTITTTTVSNNKATRDAGGVANDGSLTVNASTFSGNLSGYNCAGADCNQSFAGGLLNTATGTANVFNSTFSGNTCKGSGGGMLNLGTLHLFSSTVVNNSCGFSPGLASNASGHTYLKNTILAKNTGPGGDCTSSVTSLGHNLVGTLGNCSIGGTTAGNLVGVDPNVGLLANNGGTTFTHALLAGSPAIDAGDPAGCTDTAGHLLTTDQRGFSRTVGRACDIGSYEKGS
jgi:hypothetical protein